MHHLILLKTCGRHLRCRMASMTCTCSSCTCDVVLQPKGGELKAIGKARRDGVEVAGHSKLMTFGAFEAYAKSALRRATGNMYTAKGRILQARSRLQLCTMQLWSPQS